MAEDARQLPAIDVAAARQGDLAFLAGVVMPGRDEFTFGVDLDCGGRVYVTHELTEPNGVTVVRPQVAPEGLVAVMRGASKFTPAVGQPVVIEIGAWLDADGYFTWDGEGGIRADDVISVRTSDEEES